MHPASITKTTLGEQNVIELRFAELLLEIHTLGKSSDAFSILTALLGMRGYLGKVSVALKTASSAYADVVLSSMSELVGQRFDARAFSCRRSFSVCADSECFKTASADLRYTLPLVYSGSIYGWLFFHDDLEVAQSDFLTIAENYAAAEFKRQRKVSRRREYQTLSSRLDALEAIAKIENTDVGRILARVRQYISDHFEIDGVLCEGTDPKNAETIYSSVGLNRSTLEPLKILGAEQPLLELLKTAKEPVCFSQQQLGSLANLDNTIALRNLYLFPLLCQTKYYGYIALANLADGSKDNILSLEAIVNVTAKAVSRGHNVYRDLEQKKVAESLRIAGNIQQKLLPQIPVHINGLQFYGVNIPCDESGGDFYYWEKISDHKLVFCLADATGHGIESAMIASTARAYIRAEMMLPDRSLSEKVADINNLCAGDFPDNKFATLFIALIDTEMKTLNYVCAGHDPPALLHHAKSETFKELTSTGIPIGMLPNMRYDEVCIENIDDADILFVSSDGIHEAENSDGDFFGKTRIVDRIRCYADMTPVDIAKNMVEDVVTFRDKAPQTDDITLIALKVTDA